MAGIAGAAFLLYGCCTETATAVHIYAVAQNDTVHSGARSEKT